MKKTNITIAYDDEKLDAIKTYAGMKDTTVEDELTDHLAKIYEKFVPKDVREFFELKSGAPAPKPRQRQPAGKKAAPTPSVPGSQVHTPLQEVRQDG